MSRGARVVVLGTAQDGGVPHAGCACPNCRVARRDPALRRLVSSIAVVGSAGSALLVDATPDVGDQLDALSATTGRAPLGIDGVALTHAHVGHYLGLAFFGREAMHARGLAVHGTARMAAFLRGNRPWSHLVERGEIDLRLLAPGAPLSVGDVRVEAFLAPHRAEDTDTVGFEVRGPSKTLVYVSDADHFPPELVERIRRADVALVDGTFFGPKELPGRDLREIPHPFVETSLRVLAGARGEVHFTHLNHSNPLLDPASPEARGLPAGFFVAKDGAEFPL